MRKIPLTNGNDAEGVLMLSINQEPSVINIITMDTENACLYKLVIGRMYEYLDNV